MSESSVFLGSLSAPLRQRLGLWFGTRRPGNAGALPAAPMPLSVLVESVGTATERPAEVPIPPADVGIADPETSAPVGHETSSLPPVQVLSVPSLQTDPTIELSERMHALLFSLLGDARPETSVGFEMEAVLQKIFANPATVRDLARILVQPFLKSEKKIAAVAGLGSYGGVLAHCLAELLPPFMHGDEERRVSFLAIDRSPGKGHEWRIGAVRETGSLLRAKRVLIVAPVLSRSTCPDLQIAIKLIEEGLGANATVVGVSSLYQLKCGTHLPYGRSGTGIDYRSLLLLDFGVHTSAKATKPH